MRKVRLSCNSPELFPQVFRFVIFPNNGIDVSSVCVNVYFVQRTVKFSSVDTLENNPHYNKEEDTDLGGEETRYIKGWRESGKALDYDDQPNEKCCVIGTERHELGLEWEVITRNSTVL